MENYLTYKQLSEKIDIAEGTLRNWVCSGRFTLNKHYRKPSRRKVLFIESAIEKWMINPDPPKKKNRKPSAGEKGCLINI